MSLDQLIPPEITNDRFSAALSRIAAINGVSHLLEIGSSSGDGSTAALVKGALQNPRRPTIYCIEVSRGRFRQLVKKYHNVPFVRPYNVSSVGITDFPTERDIVDFFAAVPGNHLVGFGLPSVLSWLRQDIDYLLKNTLPQRGIELIRSEAGIERFDAVLIDGSEFTGWAELQHVRGARFIMLDDITTFKNHRSHNSLLEDPDYRLVESDRNVRNGYSIFEHK